MSGQTLTQASAQLFARPADERYSSLEALHAACVLDREHSREAPNVPYSTLRADVRDGEVMLVGQKGIPARLTNWSFGQLSRVAGAPPSYLADLSPTLAAQNLNYGLAHKAEGCANVLQTIGSDVCTVKAFTTDSYTRIFNADCTERLLGLQTQGWQPAPAAFDGSRGLYKGDRDMFCFLVDNGRRIFETLPGGGLSRGFFLWNSEVGAASIGIMTFLYEYVCGNHRVWGARNVNELRFRHVGRVDARSFREITWELRKYSDAQAGDDEAKITSMRGTLIGQTKDDVLDKIFGKKLPGLTRKLITDGYERAEAHVDWYGDPRSVWGLTGGLTEIARDLPNADDRVEVDRAAAKLSQMAF